MTSEGFSYQTASRVLNEADKNRILCCYLHLSDPNVNWQAASDAFGSASTASFKKMVANALKKVKDAEALGDEGIAAAEAKVAKSTAATGKKRKNRADEDVPANGAAEETGDQEQVSPPPQPPKKKGRKAKNPDVEDEDEKPRAPCAVQVKVESDNHAIAEDAGNTTS
nr:hypothetical protein CFP56_33727 [Quercus suber]